jgi:protein-tyrosine phosphatase
MDQTAIPTVSHLPSSSHLSLKADGSNHTTDDKVNEVTKPVFMSTGEKAKALGCGLLRSRVLHVLGLLAIGAALFFLGPPGWIASGAVIAKALGILFAALGIGFGVLGLGYGLYNHQKISFELTAIQRKFGSKNYNTIIHVVVEDGKFLRVADDYKDPEGKPVHRIILGAAPDAFAAGALDPKHLVNKENVTQVISVTQPDFERDSIGTYVPYSEADWKNAGVDFQAFDVEDHTLMSLNHLDTAANTIFNHLNGSEKSKTIYVHCRAGRGRSGQVVAASLIKHLGASAEHAAQLITEARPIATTMKKIDPKDKSDTTHGLRNFEKQCDNTETTKPRAERDFPPLHVSAIIDQEDDEYYYI